MERVVRHESSVWRPDYLAGLELTRTSTTLDAQPRHFHAEHQIGLIRSGEGVFHYRGGRYAVGAGRVAVIQAGEAHSCFTNAPKGWSFSILYIAPELFDDMKSGGRGGEVAHFPTLTPQDPALTGALSALFRGVERIGGRLEQEAQLLHVLTRLTRHRAAGPPREQALGREPSAVLLVKSYLHDHLSEDVTLGDLVALTSLSKFYLLRSFTHAVGMTPHDYQTSLRISRAKMLLREGQPLVRIAVELGFADQPHFAKTFKKLVGLTPGQYRAQS